METEEDDNSKDTIAMTPTTVTATISTEMTDASEELLNVQPQCGPHLQPECSQLEPGGGDAASQSQPPSSPKSETETELAFEGEHHDMSAGDNTCGAKLSELEVGESGGESSSPHLLLPSKQTVPEGGQAESGQAEEDSGQLKDESRSIESPELAQEESGQAREKSRGIEAPEMQEVPDKEEEDVGLIAGEEVFANKNNSDLCDKDINRLMDSEVEDGNGVLNSGVEAPELDKEAEAKMEVVADVMPEMEGVDGEGEKNIEKTDISEEANKDTTDVSLEVEMADIADDTAELEEKKEEVNEEVEEEKEGEVVLNTEREEEAASEEREEDINEAGAMDEAEMGYRTGEKENEEEMDEADVGEEVEMAEEAENAEMEVADGTEGAGDGADDVSRSAGGKRKRAKNAKSPARVSSGKKAEEDVCFICFDGGELVLCDRRGCPKAYHPSCVNRDEAFFQSKGRWNCGFMYTTTKFAGVDLCEGT